MFAAGNIPHACLFRRMAAAVHRGGAGTAGTGLRSGIPAVITPLAADQPAGHGSSTSWVPGPPRSSAGRH